MSKIFLIGDSHLGLGYPNKLDSWHKVHQEYFKEFLIPLLKERVSEGDIIVHLGDLFDNRNVIPINILNYAQNLIESISKIAPLHIIIGNHDLFSKSYSEINSIKLYKFIPNVFIYESPKKIEYLGKDIVLMPYVDKKKDQIDLLKSFGKNDYLFCHSDLNGCKMHLTSSAHKNLDKIDVDEFGLFKKVFSGHVHLHQRSKNFVFVGSNFQMDRNDMGDQKGIYILDVITGDEEFVHNTISPVFKRINIIKEEDILQLDGLNTKDYIDLYISNSLLVNNRKLRRKLETILEKGNFASVEYIDDIRIDENGNQTIIDTQELINETVVNAEDINFDYIKTIEFKDVIRDYITGSNYDSDKIKLGILSEFNEIVRLYEEEYKDKK